MARTRTLARIGCAVMTSTPRALVDSSSRARRTTSTRSLGRMNPPAEESPPLSILIATARFPVGRIADMNPAGSPLDELVMPNRLAADERDPRHGPDHILERIRLGRLGDHQFRDG